MKTKTAKQIFDFLPGVWKITRNVESNVLYENIKAQGYAAFVVSKDDDNLILYSEKVTVHNINMETISNCAQKYKYKYDPTKLSISKYFNDGKFFYTMNILDQKICGEHLCILDKYVPNYVFDNNSFTLTYSVNGPSKCYEIITEYTKISIDDVSILGLTIENEEIA